MAASGFHKLSIAEIRRETEDAVSLAFDVPEALRPAFAFSPGQYLTLRATLDGAEVRRYYSICSGLDDGELRVAIKHVPGGVFSGHANKVLREGDTIEAMPPAGRFGAPLMPDAARTHVGIAAGSGITPVLSILRSVLSREPASRFVLLYGSRATAAILFREALEDLKDRFLGRLSVVHVLSREAQDVPVLAGRLDAAKLGALLPSLVAPGAIDHAYVCGPSTMIDAAVAMLAGYGVPPGHIHTERFTPSGDAPRAPVMAAARTAPHATATIIHDGIATEIAMAQGEAVLDAALRAGLDLPWSCRGGMCSTCRARVSEGRVEMTQNFSLEPWETEAGYVLTCQAHARTPHLVVDYDHV
jgi:ring-1,2-phenylacetyl-CoA epoxidase subunit PaaE